MQPVTEPGQPANHGPANHGPANHGPQARGRWIWTVSGVCTVAVLAGLGSAAVLRASRTEAGRQPESAFPARTVTIGQPVTSVSVDSYGAPIRVFRGPVSHVTVTEAVSYDQATGRPRVIAAVSHGALTLGAPACENVNCSVAFTVAVPARVAVTASSQGGDISVTGASTAALDSGGGPLTADDIQGALSATSESGSVDVRGAGSANVDSGGGPVTVNNVPGTLSVNSDSGSVFVNGSGPASIDSGGGPVTATAVRGALTVNSDSGSINVAGARGAQLDSGGGPVLARAVHGPLNINSDSGTVQVSELSGTLNADTGGGPCNASGVTGPSARVNTDGGTAWLGFARAPQSVQVTTGGAPAVLVLPGGPYAVTANAGGGPESLTVPRDPAASAVISVSTAGGDIQVKPGRG
jgi:hypothetical protein